MRSRNLAVLGLVFALVLAIGILFWPTIYRYERIGPTLVRINRVTGETAIFRGGTWKTREPERKAKTLPWEARLKVTGNAGLTGYGSFSGKFYNGSDWTIARATFRVVAKEASGKVRWDRRFADDIIVAPLSTASFYIPVTGDDDVAKTEWNIEELEGYPPK